MDEEIMPEGELAIPFRARGRGQAMAHRLKGTENEIWTKYLHIMNKHRAMTHDDWMAEIEKAKGMKARAYA